MFFDFKKALLFLVFCLPTLSVMAQEIVPLNRSHLNHNSKTKETGKRTAQDPLQLPFFDDFSTSRDSLNYTLWVKRGGTFLNNSSALNPPSYNVVTFNGYDSTGTPYNITDPLFSGPTDNLTSQPIDLSTYSSANALYLSFMWQAEGLAEEPDRSGIETDSISLLFLDKDSLWHYVWTTAGESVEPFQNAVIPISDPAFFWSGFQFRLVSFGNLSGGFDNWHVDYFYLNSDRSPADTIREDVAISTTPRSFLKRYSSMPYNQFYNFIDKETDVPKVYLYSLRNAGTLVTPKLQINRKGLPATYITQNADPNSIQPFQPDSIAYSSFDPAALKTQLSLPSSLGDRDTMQLKLRYELLREGIEAIKMNDTLSIPVDFKDYFAYDDGTAEAAFKIDGRESKVAIRYEVNVPDTLTAIDVHFPLQINNLSGQSLKLMIWKRFGDQDSLIKGLSAALQYSSKLNGFTRYTLPTTDQIVLDGTFYIGYEQTSTEALYIGYDRNLNSNSEIFYKLGSESTASNFDKYPGSLMIRPVFGKGALVTAADKPAIAKKFKIYPNPTDGKLTIEGEIDALSVYDPTGRLVYLDRFNKKKEQRLDLSIFPAGLYLFKVTQGGTIFSERVLFER
jgi:hypothetical protein